jgi:hypothetical protein
LLDQVRLRLMLALRDENLYPELLKKLLLLELLYLPFAHIWIFLLLQI